MGLGTVLPSIHINRGIQVLLRRVFVYSLYRYNESLSSIVGLKSYLSSTVSRMNVKIHSTPVIWRFTKCFLIKLLRSGQQYCHWCHWFVAVSCLGFHLQSWIISSKGVQTLCYPFRTSASLILLYSVSTFGCLSMISTREYKLYSARYCLDQKRYLLWF